MKIIIPTRFSHDPQSPATAATAESDLRWSVDVRLHDCKSRKEALRHLQDILAWNEVDLYAHINDRDPFSYSDLPRLRETQRFISPSDSNRAPFNWMTFRVTRDFEVTVFYSMDEDEAAEEAKETTEEEVDDGQGKD